MFRNVSGFSLLNDRLETTEDHAFAIEQMRSHQSGLLEFNHHGLVPGIENLFGRPDNPG